MIYGYVRSQRRGETAQKSGLLVPERCSANEVTSERRTACLLGSRYLTLSDLRNRCGPPAAAMAGSRRTDIVGHSSGTPALRSPAKYVASNKARIFGTPNCPLAFRRAMLE
jgi:hypothetical protein